MEWLTGAWPIPKRIGDAMEEKWWEDLPPDSPWKRPGVYRLVALDPKSSNEPKPEVTAQAPSASAL
jgi:hypothetical protein